MKHRCILFFIAAYSANAQQAPLPMASVAVEASGPDSRLRQLEGIYQQQLRARHIPLLGKYLTDLQQNARLADSPVWQAEIQRVQAIITAGGVVDLSAAARELYPAAATAATPSLPGVEEPKRAMVTLTPSLAQSIQPLPASSASPVSAIIGQLNWRIASLPAGSYELVLHYASLTPEEEVPVTVELAGQKLTQVLDAKKATKDNKTFRLLRLGQMTLEKEVSGQPVILTAGTKDKPALIVRNLVITRTQKAE
jgi:hypothetical protein